MSRQATKSLAFVDLRARSLPAMIRTTRRILVAFAATLLLALLTTLSTAEKPLTLESVTPLEANTPDEPMRDKFSVDAAITHCRTPARRPV